jgi:hypothetical protein
MQRLKSLFCQQEFHVLLFCLSLLLFSWPVVSFSDIDRLHTMFIYLFIVWGLIVFLLFLVSRSIQIQDESREDGPGKK